MVLALIATGAAFPGGAAGQVSQIASAPAPAALVGLYCRTVTDCVAVGATGLQSPASLVTERWNGVRWSRSALPAPAGTVLSSGSVACPTARECVAVGPVSRDQVPLAEYWNGSRWSLGQAAIPKSPSSGIIGSGLNAISCPAPRNCYAVGWYMPVGSEGSFQLTEHWNGSSWSEQTAPEGIFEELSGISCRTTAFCVAVGEQTEGNGSFAELWNGRTWTVTKLPSTPPVQISSVSCLAVTSCFAVGSDGAGDGSLVVRWNGKTWSSSHTPGPAASVSSGLQSISCGSSAGCLAVGNDTGGVYAVAWNGHAWHLVAVPASGKLGYFEQVQCLSATSCVALGATTATAATQRFETAFWNGRTWRIVPTV